MISIPDAYKNLLDKIAEQPRHFLNSDLVAFHPMQGPGKNVDTMYIGRALNGWHWNFRVDELIPDSDIILNKILSDKHEADAYEDRLEWVEKYWKNSTLGYNTAKSQFWQVIRQVCLERSGPDDQWWGNIVWTNFFKVAPANRNPTGKMINVLGTPSHELLLAEINHYQPSNIVCLSGMNYAAHLLASAATTTKIPTENSTLEYVGDVTWESEKTVRFIIAPHPQSRSSSRIAREISPLLNDKL